MATLAPTAVRQPFAALDAPRLQQLASAKNRQNGMLTQKALLGGKPDMLNKKISTSLAKRSYAFNDIDTENVDPSIFSSPSKKVKSSDFDKPVKPFTFSLGPAINSMPPPSTIPSRLSTPSRANSSSLRTPLTAPAGRSPKRKIAGIGKTRRISAPFTRVEPPFATRSISSSTMPFSLDAALSGTLPSAVAKPNVSATIQEAMPSNWFFDIHEDSAEEEASNLMEHSTLTLDLSSDEEGSKKDRRDVGKENIAPDGYDAPSASRTARSANEPHGSGETLSRIKKTDLIRNRLAAADEMDDGQRSPLSDLEAEHFYPAGLDKDAHVVVDTLETSQPVCQAGSSVGLVKQELDSLATVASGDADPTPDVSELANNTTDDFTVWEDSTDLQVPASD